MKRDESAQPSAPRPVPGWVGARDGGLRGRGAWIVAAALVVLAGLGFFLIRGGLSTVRPPSAPGGEVARSADARPGTPRDEPVPFGPGVQAPPASSSFRVTGRVVENATGKPVAGVDVALVAPEDLVHVSTDELGCFELDLRADRWELGRSYHAVVTAESDLQLFLGDVVLEPELSIRSRTRLVLRGVLRTNFDRGIEMKASEPPSSARTAARTAGTLLLDQRRFELPVSVERIPESFQLAFEAGGYPFLTVEVATEELVSREGASLEWNAGELTILVVDETGVPLDGVNVEVGPVGNFGCTGTSTRQGRVSFLMPEGPVAVVARRHFDRTPADEEPGMAYEEVEMEAWPASVEETIVMHPVTDLDRIVGQVLDGRGNPVPEAFVSADLDTGNATVDAYGSVQARTDAEGAFSIAFPNRLAVQLTASKQGLGDAVKVHLPPGERSVTLRFERRYDLLVDLAGNPGEFGPVSWLLIRRPGNGHPLRGHAWGDPFEIDDVPSGEHDLYAFLSEAGLFGRAAVSTDGDGPVRVLAATERASFAAGILLSADGSPASGLNLRLISTDLPDPVIEHWGKGSTDVQGSFRILVGPSGAGEAAVLDLGGNELGRIELLPGRRTYRLAR